MNPSGTLDGLFWIQGELSYISVVNARYTFPNSEWNFSESPWNFFWAPNRLFWTLDGSFWWFWMDFSEYKTFFWIPDWLFWLSERHVNSKTTFLNSRCTLVKIRRFWIPDGLFRQTSNWISRTSLSLRQWNQLIEHFLVNDLGICPMRERYILLLANYWADRPIWCWNLRS